MYYVLKLIRTDTNQFMISKINLAKTLGIKHRLDLNLDSKPQHKSIVLKLIRTNTDQSLMSKINAAKTLGIKHRLDLDLDSKPQHRSIESRASSFPQKKIQSIMVLLLLRYYHKSNKLATTLC